MSGPRGLLPAALMCLVAGALPGQWPQFRGPNGSGVEPGSGYPVEFSPQKNVVWKAAVPYGQSSPVLAAGRVYVTAADRDRLFTIALDAASGRELWRRELRRERVSKAFKANDPASPTPAADDKGVVVFFPDFGLAAWSHDGEPQWTVPLGPFNNFYGMSGSPIVYRDLVIQLCDELNRPVLLAFDRVSGKERWRRRRDGNSIGWSTPILFQPPDAPAQLITLGTLRVDAYYPSTGEPIWHMPIGSQGAIGLPVTAGETIYFSTTGSPEPLLPLFESAAEKYDLNKDGRLTAKEFTDPDLGEHFGWIDLDSDGIITAGEWNTTRELGRGDYGTVAVRPGSARGRIDPASALWRFKKNLPYIPSPLYYRDIVYTVRTGGIVTSLNPATGTVLKEGRATGAPGEYYASPVAADGKLYLASEEGKLSVLKAGPQWEVTAVNDLGEEVHATPALAAGRVFVRTRSAIYCFGTTP